MYRNISRKLSEWKESKNRKPLLLRGARQTGKSYSITEFGKTDFVGKLHIVNFEKNPEVHSIFDPNLDGRRILSELELFVGSRIVPGDDLVFFDEIQECPKAIMALRYFYEQIPNLHIIAAGSLLEFALRDISFPVGRLQMLSMNPMTFREFLIATDKAMLAEKIDSELSFFSSNVVELINAELYKYFIVGGMPECVKVYSDTRSFSDIFDIQTDLIATFRQDFSKYAGVSDKRCLNNVLTSVAAKVGEQIKYTHLTSDFSNPTIRKAFELLETARLYTRVKAASPAGIPLGADVSDKKFKAVFLDIGLMSNLSGFNPRNLIGKQKLLSAFNGRLAEQFVGQEFRAAGRAELYYWSRDARGSNAETDYLIESGAEIVPVEIKSGKSGRLRSLHLLLQSYSDIRNSYVFTEDKYGKLPDQKITFLPLFLAGVV